MDVKCAFLNVLRVIIFLNHVFNLKKTLYGLKQAPCAGYEKLSSFFMTNDFQRGKVDITLFRKNYDSQFIIIQIYVDDIIFCATDDSFHGEFFKLMQKEFAMSMIGE
ncbi:hypothetical protein CR513_23678, partial [Mucuna pruriens]